MVEAQEEEQKRANSCKGGRTGFFPWRRKRRMTSSSVSALPHVHLLLVLLTLLVCVVPPFCTPVGPTLCFVAGAPLALSATTTSDDNGANACPSSFSTSSSSFLLSPSARWPNGVAIAQSFIETTTKSNMRAVYITAGTRRGVLVLDTAANLIVLFNSTTCVSRRNSQSTCYPSADLTRNTSLDTRTTWLFFKDQETFIDRAALTFSVQLQLIVSPRGSTTAVIVSPDGGNTSSTARANVTYVSTFAGASTPVSASGTPLYTAPFHGWLDFDGFLGLAAGPSLAIRSALDAGALAQRGSASSVSSGLTYVAPNYTYSSVARNIIESTMAARRVDSSSLTSLSADGDSMLMALDFSASRWWIDGVPSEYANRTTWSCPAPSLPPSMPTFLMYDVRICNVSLTSPSSTGSSNTVTAPASALQPPSLPLPLPVSVAAVIDTGTPCLSLPSEWFDTVVSVAPLSCAPETADPNSPAQVCYIASDQSTNLLPALQFRTSPDPAASTFFVSLTRLLLLDSGSPPRMCLTRSGSLFATPSSTSTSRFVSGGVTLPAYVGFGALSLLDLVVVLDMSNTSTVVGLSQADGSSPSTVNGRCISTVRCVGMQTLDTRINVCIDPPCSSLYLLHYDDATAKCVLPSMFQPFIAVAIAIVIVVELALNEAIITMKQKVRRARLGA